MLLDFLKLYMYMYIQDEELEDEQEPTADGITTEEYQLLSKNLSDLLSWSCEFQQDRYKK